MKMCTANYIVRSVTHEIACENFPPEIINFTIKSQTHVDHSRNSNTLFEICKHTYANGLNRLILMMCFFFYSVVIPFILISSIIWRAYVR